MKKYKFIWGFLFLLLVSSCADLYNRPVTPEFAQAWQGVEHYQINSGVAVDSRTNLMWLRCLVGSTLNGNICEGIPATYSWAQAQAIAKSFNYAGYSDWRVPTLEELKSLAVKQGTPPAVKVLYLNNTVFPMTICQENKNEAETHLNDHTCWHWSSTPIEGADRYVSVVYFGYGYASGSFDSDSYALRLVRNYH